MCRMKRHNRNLVKTQWALQASTCCWNYWMIDEILKMPWTDFFDLFFQSFASQKYHLLKQLNILSRTACNQWWIGICPEKTYLCSTCIRVHLKFEFMVWHLNWISWGKGVPHNCKNHTTDFILKPWNGADKIAKSTFWQIFSYKIVIEFAIIWSLWNYI